MLSKSRDDPTTEVVGAGLVHGMPGETCHFVVIGPDEYSVQVQSSVIDDHELQCPVEDEMDPVGTMGEACGYFIRWPAKDMKRADAQVEEAATAAVQSQAAVEATLQSPVKKQKAKEVTKKTTSKKLVPDKAEVSPLTQ